MDLNVDLMVNVRENHEKSTKSLMKTENGRGCDVYSNSNEDNLENGTICDGKKLIKVRKKKKADTKQSYEEDLEKFKTDTSFSNKSYILCGFYFKITLQLTKGVVNIVAKSILTSVGSLNT